MSYPYISPKKLGHDFNFFQKIAVTSGTFGGTESDGYNPATGYYGPDMVITFPTCGLILTALSGTGTVEYSFNGNTVHGELTVASAFNQQLTFNNRSVSMIWLRVQSGSTGPITISVQAWGNR